MAGLRHGQWKGQQRQQGWTLLNHATLTTKSTAVEVNKERGSKQAPKEHAGSKRKTSRGKWCKLSLASESSRQFCGGKARPAYLLTWGFVSAFTLQCLLSTNTPVIWIYHSAISQNALVQYRSYLAHINLLFVFTRVQHHRMFLHSILYLLINCFHNPANSSML